MKDVRQAMIYIGMNDSILHEQKFETEKYISVLKNICKSYKVAFSMNVIDGGYFHDDGTYVEEKTLVLTLLDVDEQTVEEIAKDLCAFFHQESVMISFSNVMIQFVRESIV